ncbi:MAG: hypothetical protein ABIQ88_02325 [Chitinophagaceae bacterium]
MLPTFFFAENQTELPGAGFIICTRPPYFLLKVLKFTQDDAETFSANTIAPFMAVPGYRVYLQLHGQLDGRFDPNVPDDDLSMILPPAVTFYLTEKITPNAHQFKRYRTP